MDMYVYIRLTSNYIFLKILKTCFLLISESENHWLQTSGHYILEALHIVALYTEYKAFISLTILLNNRQCNHARQMNGQFFLYQH